MMTARWITRTAFAATLTVAAAGVHAAAIHDASRFTDYTFAANDDSSTGLVDIGGWMSPLLPGTVWQ